MKLLMKRMGMTLLMLALVVTMVPLHGASAESEMQPFYFDMYSTDIAYPTPVNERVIELSGTFRGVSQNTITYRVEKIVNGAPVFEGRQGENPFIENGDQFRFINIELYEGLNIITVEGINNAGNPVGRSVYIEFYSSPTIYDIKLVDDRQLEQDKPVLVDQEQVTILLLAPNATTVEINGHPAYSGGSERFMSSGINLDRGLNTISIVARNETMQTSLSRQLVYKPLGELIAYGVRIGDVLIDGFPTVGPNTTDALTGGVRGHIVFDHVDGAAVTIDDAILKLFDESNSLMGEYQIDIKPNPEITHTYSGSYITFEFETQAGEIVNIEDNGSYTLVVEGEYAAQQISYSIPFQYRDENTPYIVDVLQLHNPRIVDESERIISFTSSPTPFTNNHRVFELPIWLMVETEKFDVEDPANYLAEIVSLQGGAISPGFSATRYKTADGDLVYRIDHMPAGDQILRITIAKDDLNDSFASERTITTTYVPAASIRLDNIYNGQVFSESEADAFQSLQGKLINFNLGSEADLGSLSLRVNGITVNLYNRVNQEFHPNFNLNTTTGTFTFELPPEMRLALGSNQIIMSGNASGVDVSTTITVYKYSDTVPVIAGLRPVPYEATQRDDDPDNEFVLTSPGQYNTYNSLADVLFTLQEVDEVIVYIDGVQRFTAQRNDRNELVSNDPARLLIRSNGQYDFRIRYLELPESGVTSITVRARLGSGSISETIIITREFRPYEVLSPKLPLESVINQNFVMLSIRAEGADEILVNRRTPMIKGEDDIFRLEVGDLRQGVNEIRFSVIRGTDTLEGSVTVNYARQNIVGAQHKQLLPRNGRVRVFDNQLELQLPRNTMLRPGRALPGQVEQTIDLFEQQEILFGIADRQDGRTIKRENRVGQTDTNNNPLDGEIREIMQDYFMINSLVPEAHFEYASNLYWIDAGYIEGDSLTGYETMNGQHPYTQHNKNRMMMYNPNNPNQHFLEPTQRGTITIQYDPNIRDAAADNLAIWRLERDGARLRWKPIGGVVDKKRNTVTATFDKFGYYAVFSMVYTFNDIASHPYARNELNLIVSRGIMEWRDTENFGVYENITRGEFATMLVKMLDMPLNYDPNRMTFSDVPRERLTGSLWDYRYIETAARNGIVHGRAPRLFDPSGFITREEAAVMIARAINAKVGEPESDLPRLQRMFTDANFEIFDRYAVPSVYAIAREGIITGRPHSQSENERRQTYYFAPKDYLTRADAAVIAKRVMEKEKLL